jgi:hypothetical protein
MKLKTLKDISDVTKSGALVCNAKELKAQAIKWVKEDRESFGLTLQGEFWERRFNIIEEDLE